MQEPIVFFGSGPVAAAALERLARYCTIEAVVTKPKPAHHRGEFPVLAVAERLQLGVHMVSNRRELSDLIATCPFKSRLGVLIDFGIIVGQDTIDYFPLGIVNSHFSLLPQLRGADPITFAILEGLPRTGVSLMLLVQAMDEGPLLAQKAIELDFTETTPALTDKLVALSDELLADILPRYTAGEIQARPQDTSVEPTYSRKLTKEDGLIDWQKPAEQLEREIRAFAAWPKSRTTLGNTEVIITQAHAASQNNPDKKPGDIEVSQSAGTLTVACGTGALCIDRLKPVGKNDMPIRAFLAGYTL